MSHPCTIKQHNDIKHACYKVTASLNNSETCWLGYNIGKSGEILTLSLSVEQLHPILHQHV